MKKSKLRYRVLINAYDRYSSMKTECEVICFKPAVSLHKKFSHDHVARYMCNMFQIDNSILAANCNSVCVVMSGALLWCPTKNGMICNIQNFLMSLLGRA